MARALYKESEVLILDESTSALDKKNEENFLQNIFKLKSDKTLIIISHKMKPLKISDKIIIISGAKIDQILDYNKFYEKFSAVYE